MDPVVLESARKHGVEDEDMLHAHRHPLRMFDLGEVVMLIGSDRDGHLLEVGVALAEGIEFIVHAMPARPRFLR